MSGPSAMVHVGRWPNESQGNLRNRCPPPALSAMTCESRTRHEAPMWLSLTRTVSNLRRSKDSPELGLAEAVF